MSPNNITMKVKVTRNYQITVPSKIRKKMEIELGDILDVTLDEENEKIIIKKIGKRRKTLKLGRKLTPEEIERLIESGIKDNIK